MFGAARVKGMADHLRRFAASMGVEGMRVGDRSPCTRKALALAEHARDQGRLHPLRRALMDAFWRRGEDLEAPAVLSACAGEAGLDPAAALAALEDPAILRRVAAMGREAARAGVTGIPTFDLGELRVVGCQPYEVLAEAAERAGARRRPPA
jgi:predicted DsbA family dithiol-disulfide isomerase